MTNDFDDSETSFETRSVSAAWRAGEAAADKADLSLDYLIRLAQEKTP